MSRAAEHGADAESRRRWPTAASRGRAPVIVVLLLIALFSAIGGKPLDGLLMLLGLHFFAR